MEVWGGGWGWCDGYSCTMAVDRKSNALTILQCCVQSFYTRRPIATLRRFSAGSQVRSHRSWTYAHAQLSHLHKGALPLGGSGNSNLHATTTLSGARGKYNMVCSGSMSRDSAACED